MIGYGASLRITLNNGLEVDVMQDHEENRPGELYLNDPDMDDVWEVLPVVSTIEDDPDRQRREKIAQSFLLDREIIAVAYITSEECQELGYNGAGLQIILDNGWEVEVITDHKGNGPGTLHLFNPIDGMHQILPVIAL